MQSFGINNDNPKLLDMVLDSEDQKLRDLYSIYSPIRLNFLYIIMQTIIHSIQWTPQEYRVISILFYPYDVSFKIKNQKQQYQNWFPFYTPPFITPLRILAFGKWDGTNSTFNTNSLPLDASWLRVRKVQNQIKA